MWLERSLFTVLVSVVLYLFIFIYFKKKKFDLKYILILTILYFYAFEVFYITVLPLPLNEIGVESLQMITTNSSYINLIPIRVFFEYDVYSFTKQVIGNIVMFVPLGFLLPLVFDKCKVIKLIGCSFLVSLFIEILQLIISMFLIKAPFRVFDIDDLILNTLGAIVGYILYLSIKTIVRKYIVK